MKLTIKTLVALSALTLLSSCYELDLSPLAKGSSENWYSDETEMDMALRELYRHDFWDSDNDRWTDDFAARSTTTPFLDATLNGENSSVKDLWATHYKAISRANTVLANMEKIEGKVTEAKYNQFKGEGLFIRAAMYANLINHFGDVVYVEEVIDIDEAFKIGRSPKAEIKEKVYADYDQAAELLPSKVGTNPQRATKGAALALKARFALYNGDWKIAADAAKSCMDLNLYKLHTDYGKLFLPATHNAVESIFLLPRSIEYGIVLDNATVLNWLPRNVGGWAGYNPSWDLLAAYTCDDGLPIDESPRFDSHDPFKNRDPRCAETIVPFGSRHVGYTYEPHPDSLKVMNFKTGKLQTNNDTRANGQYASYNGLVWKKGIDDSFLENGKKVAPDKVIIRYAEVLLTYAEAMMELNKIDNTALDALNQVRARAYKVNLSATDKYPAVTEANQQKLRRIIRMERRMEFAFEGMRYMDVIRWRLAEKAYVRPVYGMLYPASDLREKVTSKGHWFWPVTPEIDEDGLPDFNKMAATGLILQTGERFWDNRQYLWPIPSKEVLINENIKQNDGY